jgi:hypothetical protein
MLMSTMLASGGVMDMPVQMAKLQIKLAVSVAEASKMTDHLHLVLLVKTLTKSS